MRKLFVLLLPILMMSFVACSTDPNSYENLLDDEKSSISDYISRNNINVIYALPSNNVWGENDYYKTSDGMYIHVVDAGVGDAVVDYQTVFARYYKISLDLVPDTLARTWNPGEEPYPLEFQYGVSGTSACNAFHFAVKIMKRSGSVAKIIVPSKLGNATDKNNVKAYFYDFKFSLGD